MRLNIKDIKNIISAVKEYLFSYEKFKKKFSPINNLSDLKIFIKERSAYVSQATLYGYLKTRMGLKTTLMFTDDVFIQSVNKSKWHIFGTCVSDLLFYTCSYLKSQNKIGNLSLQNIYEDIIDREKTNGMPSDICDSLKKNFEKKLPLFNENYFNGIPFKDSGYALYHWAPIAEDLKKLDKEVVLNSMAYKWNAVVSDFKKLSRDAKNF